MPIKDPGRLVALMALVEKVTTVAPRMTHFISEAMAELEQAHEDIRRSKQKEQGQPITPDPALQSRSVTRAIGGDPIPADPKLSEPVKKDINIGDKLPELDEPPAADSQIEAAVPDSADYVQPNDEPKNTSDRRAIPATRFTSDNPNPPPDTTIPRRL